MAWVNCVAPLARLAAVGVLLLFATTAAWADFQAGLKAYEAADYASAYRHWLPLAQGGDPAAQRNIGQLYRLGRGVARDPAVAAEWYRRAARMGLRGAQTNLARLYLTGDGVEQDYQAAGKWFKAAAVQGHAIAQYNLGVMYELGLGFTPDNAQARAWYNLAAKAGHRQALDSLSRLVAIDAVDELRHPERAAEAPPAVETESVAPPAAAEAPPDDVAEQAADTDKTAESAESGGLLGFIGRLFSSGESAPNAELAAPSPPEPTGPAEQTEQGADQPAAEETSAAERAAAAEPSAEPSAEAAIEDVAPVSEDAGEASDKGFFARIFSVFEGGEAEPGDEAGELAPGSTDAPPPDAGEPPQKLAAVPPPATEGAASAGTRPVDLSTASAKTGMTAYRQGDFQTALVNWLPLAKAGNPNAQYLLGGLFLTGAGVPPDLVRAHMWWSLSAASGHLRASRDMDALRPRMSAAQQAESARLADAWQASR